MCTMVQRVVINTAFGGFALSETLKREYCERTGRAHVWSCDVERTDPHLIALLLAREPKDRGALKVVEVPDGVAWTIEEHDGNEWVAETHRIWC